ncbi:LysR family transcriptional regulator [Phaeovulum sp.]|uniref:LysR family transcriptional regulator n=1 Tax=Phaeovulum sp. TaxID=2934796 RepID=UPI00273184CB|nr:LysR substrate-binding domain-containing protein [Phaeovulum sp.]MDP1669767.1 LysR substrate-binding domain-containing protein [Phaeovulum sp.]MDP2063271.1 LysR substrate-binding domain-containing protein [Phaeovulum sp.]MDP3862950.1 LysR substrate-binding domain-containing protein [Phaeovulum sp.]MDZ4119055.1 LysR substrate-binding domain-containing protein [Phaeovulum sp.]
MNITLRQLSYFLALIETGHFGRAAEKVHVTQPALSMQIRALEGALGLALVERLPRGLVPTRAGRVLARRAARVLAEVQELAAEARHLGLGAALHLGIIPTVAPYLLPPLLPRFREISGTGELRLREAQTALLLAALAEGALDAVVIAGPVNDPGLITQALFEDRFLLAGSAARLAALGAAREALRPRALDPDELLLLDEGHCLADQALDVCGLTRSTTRLDLGASSLATLCGLVAQGAGLTFLPELALAGEATPGLVCARFAAPEPARELLLVRRAASSGEGWFEPLAGALTAAGQGLIAAARARLP